MNAAAIDGAPAAGPFSPRAVLALVLLGGLVFVALLYMIGAGMTSASVNDGGGHAGGKGLNGYAALAEFLESRGFTVRRSQDEGALDDPGLLVLTPPQWADGAELERIVAARRTVGPTLIVTPKWRAAPVPIGTPDAKRGWVQLSGTDSPTWEGFLDDVGLGIAAMQSGQWLGGGITGTLPQPRSVQSGRGPRIVALVRARQDGGVLVGYLDDGDGYPELDRLMPGSLAAASESADLFPVVVVFEPDLLDNYGMADLANARLAERLVRAIGGGGNAVTFDLTLNGHVRSRNLLTLAFTPPFLAATLCLLIAALAIGWRAFLRFGPPLRPERAIAFGKRALVANTAGLIRRARRQHLVAEPYAAAARERLARLLALPRLPDAAAGEAAIDRALAARDPQATPFSIVAARLAAARRPHELLRAAQDLHALERKLHR